MQAIRKTIAQARRRSFYQLWLSHVGAALAWTLVVAIVLLSVARVFAIEPGWQIYLAAGGLLLAAYSVAAFVRLPDAMTLAQTLDRRLDTKDRFASALHASKLDDDGFARAVMTDAENLARKTDVRQALPLHITRSWYYAVTAAIALAAVFVFLPHDIDLMGQLAKARQRQAAQREAEQAKRQIDQAVKIIADESGQADGRQSLEQTVSELKKLSSQGLEDPATRKQAAAKVSQVRDELEKQAQDRQQTLQSLRNRMSRLDREAKGPADAFSDALRRGQFDDANDMLRQVIERVEQMSPAEQQALRDQLDNLARQLAEQQEQQAKQRQSTLEKQPETQPPAQPPEQEEKPSFAKKWMKRFSDSMREMNEAARQQQEQEQEPKQPGQEKQTQPQKTEPPSEPRQQPSPEKPEPEKEPKPEEPRRQGSPPPFMPQSNEPSQANEPQSSEQQSAEQQSGEPQPSGEKQSSDQPSRQESGEQSSPQNQKQPQSGEPQKPDGRRQEDQQPTQQQPDGQRRPEPGQDASPQPVPQPAPGPTQSPDQQPMQQQQPQPGGSEQKQDQGFSEQQLEQLKKIAEQMQSSDPPDGQPGEQPFTPEQIEQLKEIAEQMQDQLSELSQMQEQLDQLKENDRQLRDLMRQLSHPAAQREPDGPGDQAGGDPLGQPRRIDEYQKQMSRETSDANGQPVSSWLTDKPVETGRSDATYEQAVGQARESAERAIADEQLPGRYHPAVKQYFEQLPENLDQTESRQTTEP